MRVKLIVSYDGADFIGWQRQKKGRSVQGELEKALRRLLGKGVSVQGAGRTDTGVHAVGQAAGFEADLRLPVCKLAFALNNLLPRDIRVVSATEEAEDFHARFSPSCKEYRYFMLPGQKSEPFLARYAWFCPRLADIAAAEKCVALLEGEHNFRSFCGKSSVVRSYVRTIYTAEFLQARPEDVPEILYRRAQAGEVFMLRLVGSGFIYKMVRLIAGALVKVGEGKLSAGEFAEYLAEPREQPPAPAAPAAGLYLWGLDYLPAAEKNM